MARARRTSNGGAAPVSSQAQENLTAYYGCKRNNFRTCLEVCEGRVATKYHGCVSCKQVRTVRKERKQALRGAQK